MPHSTAYRIATTLERSGLVTRLRRGYYLPGPSLIRLARHDSIPRVLKAIGRPIIKRLATDTRLHHPRGDLRERHGHVPAEGRPCCPNRFYTRGHATRGVLHRNRQSPVGGVAGSRSRGLFESGPFIQLTANTLTDPQKLRGELIVVGDRGYAEDNAEMDSGLLCLAVPVRLGEGGRHRCVVHFNTQYG